MGLQGERVSLRPLTRNDLDEVEAWAPYTDPLYLAWNRFPWQQLGKDLWHELQEADPAVERYAIVDRQGRVIGVVGLVSGDEGRPALLSIFMGADFVGQGLGSEALRILLGHAFQDLDLECVRLYVAATNARARRAYEKNGFRVVGSCYRPVGRDESLAFLEEARYRSLRPFFRQEDGRTYVLFYRMEIHAPEWRALQSRPGSPRDGTWQS